MFISFLGKRGGGGGGGGGVESKIKVAQNGLKHVLVLDFLRSDEIFEISSVGTSNQPHNHTDTTVTR